MSTWFFFKKKENRMIANILKWKTIKKLFKNIHIKGGNGGPIENRFLIKRYLKCGKRSCGKEEKYD